MKKLLFVLIFVITFGLFVACDDNKESCSHQYGEWFTSKEATCMQRGEEKRVCSKCQEEEKRETPLGDHTNFNYQKADASVHNVVCECGYSFSEAHSFGNWEPMQDLKEKRTCGKCGYEELRDNTSGDADVNKVKELVISTFDNYKNSLTGSMYFKLTEGKNIKEISLSYEMKSATEAIAYGYHSKDKYFDLVNGIEKEYDVEYYAYLKDDLLYQLVNEVESADPVDKDVMKELLKNCSVANLVEQCAKYYNEDEFYNALSLVSKENNVYKFAFDLIEYQGSTINVSNKTEILFNVKIENSVVKYVELVVSSKASVNSVYISFNGLGKPTINYPESVN